VASKKGRVRLAEADDERGHHGIDQVGDAQFGDVASGFSGPADSHIADHHAAQAERSHGAEKLGSSWQQLHARDGGRTQGPAQDGRIRFRADAEPAQAAARMRVRSCMSCT
jgi:hypothetical protein